MWQRGYYLVLRLSIFITSFCCLCSPSVPKISGFLITRSHHWIFWMYLFILEKLWWVLENRHLKELPIPRMSLFCSFSLTLPLVRRSFYELLSGWGHHVHVCCLRSHVTQLSCARGHLCTSPFLHSANRVWAMILPQCPWVERDHPLSCSAFYYWGHGRLNPRQSNKDLTNRACDAGLGALRTRPQSSQLAGAWLGAAQHWSEQHPSTSRNTGMLRPTCPPTPHRSQQARRRTSDWEELLVPAQRGVCWGWWPFAAAPFLAPDTEQHRISPLAQN